jgi:hypothetical protein
VVGLAGGHVSSPRRDHLAQKRLHRDVVIPGPHRIVGAHGGLLTELADEPDDVLGRLRCCQLRDQAGCSIGPALGLASQPLCSFPVLLFGMRSSTDDAQQASLDVAAVPVVHRAAALFAVPDGEVAAVGAVSGASAQLRRTRGRYFELVPARSAADVGLSLHPAGAESV